MQYDKMAIKTHASLARDIEESAVTEYPSEEDAVDLFLRDCYNSYYELQILMREYDTLRKECFTLHDKIHKLVSRLITDDSEG